MIYQTTQAVLDEGDVIRVSRVKGVPPHNRIRLTMLETNYKAEICVAMPEETARKLLSDLQALIDAEFGATDDNVLRFPPVPQPIDF